MPLKPEVKARLTARFNARLPQVLQGLEHALEALEQDRPEGWMQARHLAHQLAGTAASFGWPELAARAQELLKADQEAGLGLLAALVAETRRAIRRSPSSAEPDVPDP